MRGPISIYRAQPLASGSLEPNALAASYQPRRMWAAIVSISWNLAWADAFVAAGGAQRLDHLLGGWSWWAALAGAAVFFCIYAAANLPLELWYGYIQERQFGLVKQGLRSWWRDWVIGNIQHGAMFVIGSSLLLTAQHLWPVGWLLALSAGMLAIFLASTWLAPMLIPSGLFEFGRPDAAELARLQTLAGKAHRLPTIVLFTWPESRDFSGGLMGLGRRQILLISRATLELGSDAMLRFVLLHELGHRRYHHLLLSTLAVWAYATIGLVCCDAAIVRLSPMSPGSIAYLPWMALFFTAWMVLGQPALAYLGRRLEYQADRFYLDHGGNLEEMSAALAQLSQRDLVRTDTMRRRQSLVEPVPIVARRLLAAGLHLAGKGA